MPRDKNVEGDGGAPGGGDADPRQSALDYLESHRILTMATASLSGEPDATALEYASDGFDVYVSVRPGSRKVQNLRENPRVFYEIHDDIPITLEHVKKLKALQVAATADILSSGDPEFDRGFEALASKFPVFRGMRRDSRVILRFKPKKAWLLDYSKKFFFRHEITFDS